jgi:hypothetical protein
MPASRSSYVVHHIIYCSIFIFVSPRVTTYAQAVNPMDHPNHYVLLIDASGSAMPKRNRMKKEAFEKGVLRTLPTELFEKGFNKKIPLYDPQHDYLTVLHFWNSPWNIRARLTPQAGELFQRTYPSGVSLEAKCQS